MSVNEFRARWREALRASHGLGWWGYVEALEAALIQRGWIR